MDRKRIAVLGSTGSIGRQALEVAAAMPDAFEVTAICASHNAALTVEQARACHARYIGIADEGAALSQTAYLPQGAMLVTGEDAAAQLAALAEVDIVVLGISGIAALPALLAALKAGKTVALANKESIVCGNVLVNRALKQYQGRLLPVDSEQSAIFQCLHNGNKQDVRQLILTASGGPFWQLPQEQWETVTPEQALCHPTWRMGKKITIDSATLFNKGLEVMEASFLFDVPKEHILVLIHPQSIVHSMVEYMDGAIMAQMSLPDMRLAIQYAMTYPDRLPGPVKQLSLTEAGALTFFPAMDYPAISLAYAALGEGKTLPIVYNGANEAAVELFIAGSIGFLDIYRSVEYAMGKAAMTEVNALEDIMEVDAHARAMVREWAKGKGLGIG